MKTKIAAAFVLTALASSMAVAAENQLGGLYVGAGLGIANASSTIEDSDCWYECSAYTQRPNGAALGVQVGQNFVDGNLLFGWGMDYALANDAKKKFNYAYYTGNVNSVMQASSEFKAALALRAKAGLVVNDTALTLSFGPAMGDFTNKLIDRSGVGHTAKQDGNIAGFVYGVGLEHAWSKNLVITADLSHYVFGDQQSLFMNPDGTPNSYHVKFINSADIAKVGVNYKF